MKIAIISGSTRIGRASHSIAQYIEKRLIDKGVETTLLDLKEYSFPVFDERLTHLEEPHSGLKDFSNKLTEADALIFVTPEYNGSLPGSFKNSLDFFRSEFKRKPMGSVTVSSGPFGGINAYHQLLFWMSYVGGIPSPTKLLVSDVNNAFDEHGVPTERLQRNGDGFLDDLIWLTEKVSS